MGGILFVYFIFALIVQIIFGIVTLKMNENKGYYGGFWWGFFLGWIGIVVIACKRENVRSNYCYNSEADRALSSYAIEKHNQQLMIQGGWKCAECGRTNANYVTTCVCGISKNYKKENVSAASKADEIEKFKKLLDAGAITQEEYDKKKKQILM